MGLLSLPPTSVKPVRKSLEAIYAVPFFFIEPISYYPVYGDAGNYMSMTTGNVSNLRLPCAAVAQAVAGVPEGTRKGAAIAAVGIAVCLPETGSDFDAGRSAQNMMLAAWSMGIASCPCSMHDRECASKTLGLLEGWRVCVVLALGYPDPKVSMHLGKKRVELSELAHEERW